MLGWFSKVTVERWIELKIAKDKAELELETTKSLEKLKAELAVEGAKTIGRAGEFEGKRILNGLERRLSGKRGIFSI